MIVIDSLFESEIDRWKNGGCDLIGGNEREGWGRGDCGGKKMTVVE